MFCTFWLRHKVSGVTVDGRPVGEDRHQSSKVAYSPAIGQEPAANNYEGVDDLPLQSSLNLNSGGYDQTSSNQPVMHISNSIVWIVINIKHGCYSFLKHYELSLFFKEFGSRANTGRVTFEGNSNKQDMYGGASSRPMAWSGGGSTQVSELKN